MASETRVGILGGGPAGLWAALELARRGFAPVLIERSETVGGNAGSFDLGGIPVDYGSHRLHPNTDPRILAVLRTLLGPDLLQRPRRGRIFLRGRWIHFPLRPLNLAHRADPRFLFGVLSDMALRLVSASGAKRAIRQEPQTFASLLYEGLGPTICEDFYFPYARKIWGLAPQEISPTQAVKRVSARSMTSLARRLLPGGTGSGGGRNRGTFFYPRGGFGQISEEIRKEAEACGATTILGTIVKGVRLGESRTEVLVERDGTLETLTFDYVWSTIPLGPLVRMMDPPPSADVLRSAGSLRQRAMVLVYLLLGQDRFTEFDAHYVPSLDVPFSRLSEPKNYSGAEDPKGRTVLCAEIPCSVGDPPWTLEASELGDLVRDGLRVLELPLRSPVLQVAVRRLPYAYPILDLGYETHLDRVEGWVGSQPRLLSFGRQGLFTHDNTHHALYTARSAVHCLGDDGRFDRDRWAQFRRVFASQVVED